MKKLVQNIFKASVLVIFTSTAYAQGTRGYSGSSPYVSSVSFGTPNEIITNFTSGSLLSGKQCKNCDNQTTITIQGAYLRTIDANIQAGAIAGIQSISGGNSDSLLTLVALGVYNFDTSFKNAFFAQGGIGIYPVLGDRGDYENKFGFLIGAGKRFPLWGNVNYIPTVSLVKKGDLDLMIDIQFLNFSIMF